MNLKDKPAGHPLFKAYHHHHPGLRVLHPFRNNPKAGQACRHGIRSGYRSHLPCKDAVSDKKKELSARIKMLQGLKQQSEGVEGLEDFVSRLDLVKMSQ